ncbi:HEAT repeat domain-containing protein [Nodosilinea nodulosa]|uniref:HEAT repeat domain-containing protein n=1 Tax=Nodosilinea nodulosa TaxID=416001 RepID=UPI0012D79518|nr:HEAT repeat domain-containing protein [Nodosilinea nodulosa]
MSPSNASFDQRAVSVQGTGYPAEPDAGARTAAVRAAVARLGAGDFHDRWEQLRQVADLGEAALADLLAMLKDDDQDWEARWFAARLLGELNDAQVIPALIDTFAATTDEELRQAVATALTQIGPPAIAALGQQLADPRLRPMAVQALARIHHPDTVPLLLEALEDGRSPVRATALSALSAFAHPSIWPAVQRSLEDVAAPVRLAAIRGLLGLRSQLSAAALIQALTPRLWDQDLGVAQQAAYALGRLAIAAAAAPLIQRLQAPSLPEAVQICAAQALAWQQTPAALAGLTQTWDSLGEQARAAAVQGLAAVAPALKLQTALALSTWLEALPATPAHAPLRCHLVLALGQMGDLAQEPALRSLLNDAEPSVRLHAEAALRQLRADACRAL